MLAAASGRRSDLRRPHGRRYTHRRTVLARGGMLLRRANSPRLGQRFTASHEHLSYGLGHNKLTTLHMQTYDLLMLLVLMAATLFGFWKGMAWQIASLASLVVSYVAALRFSEQLAPVFGEHAPWNRFVAMLAIYVGVSFFIWMVFRLVSGVIDKVRLESFDRQLGAMFGAAKGVLLCVAITFFAVTLLPPTQGEAIVASQSGRYIVALLDKSHTVFPPEIHDVIDPYINKLEQRLNPGAQPHAQDLQNLWPSQAQSQTAAPFTLPQGGFPQIPWPQAQSQWPTQSPQAPASPPARDPYSVPREPNPFPGPYSAEVPASRDF
jgi:membrane protein required for colicin V production